MGQGFRYRMVRLPDHFFVTDKNWDIAPEVFQKIVNDHAHRGWEFFRMDRFGVTHSEKPGCFSFSSELIRKTQSFYVLTFRAAVGTGEHPQPNLEPVPENSANSTGHGHAG